MFIIPEPSSNILDTVRRDLSGLFLKPFHALRTYEAYQFLSKIIDLKSLLIKYDEIEALLGSQLDQGPIFRIIFSPTDFTYRIEAAHNHPLPAVIPLQIISTITQPSGLGKQNFKWQERNYWDTLLAQKSKLAFDVISLNEKTELVETSRFNLFFFDKLSDEVKTPALRSGCINGVYRRFILQKGYIHLPGLGEKRVTESLLPADTINRYQLFVANSVREVLPAELVE